MKEKIQALNDSQLIELADELTKTTLPDNALARTVIGDSKVPFQLLLIELNCILVQVLAERLRGCSPHIEK